MTELNRPAPIKVLVVDDNDHDAKAFRRALAKSDLAAEITRCATGEDAMERIFADGSAFDLAVIDHNLPGIKGLQVCRKIASAGIELPLIFLTGSGSENLAVQAFKSGAYDYLVKDSHQGYLALLPVVAKEVLRTHADRRANREMAAALKLANLDLENRVQERAAQIETTNIRLEEEVEDRRQAQEDLGRSKAMLQAVFDGISDPLILLDQGMVIRMINTAASSYYGFNRLSEAVGRISCIDIAGKPRGCEGCPIPAAVMAGEHLTFEREGLLDSRRLERVVVYPIQGPEKNIGNAVVHVMDITEAKQIERQLIQNEKLASLGLLVSSIAHEINNPNNFISFNIPILRDYLNEILPIVDRHAAKSAGMEFCNMAYPEFRNDILKLIDNIGHGADRISSFVGNLREFSRSDEHRPKEWIDLMEPVNKALSICDNKIKKSVRTFVKDIPGDLPPIFSDPHAIEQVLINLLVNAAQAADKKNSWIKLKIAVTESRAEHTLIEVSDNGRGMEAEILIRIFDPFFTTKSSIEGTGLGLYVCRNLINGIGGRLDVESEPGKGSKFTIVLHDNERHEMPKGA